MRRGIDFSQVLQERLEACPVAEVSEPTRGGPTPPPSLGFFFNHPGLASAVPPHANPRRWQAPRPQPRPRRTFMPHEQRALDYLVGLGARLEPDLTMAELRSAFRALAREYHPDRHPGSSPQQRERLAALFRRLRQAYEHLQGAIA
ncbi:MAG: J domain-containing protein [Acidobacteria bacterium]|nr:J domain-containing protein [Acidobacteriota bacterium]